MDQLSAMFDDLKIIEFFTYVILVWNLWLTTGEYYGVNVV